MSFHLYRINELYSNASGTLQFVEMTVGNANGESFWQGITLSTASGALAVLAADHALNTAHIDLVGLAQTGIEFVV